MQIAKNKVVSLHYRLQENNETGEMVEETYGAEPLVFLYGTGQMIPEFERQLSGKNEGEKFAFGIKSDEAYGPVDEDAIVLLPLSVFEVDGELDYEMLTPGEIIPMSDDQGNQLQGMVQEVKNDGIVINFNHPMAGQDLYFTGVIESVREASPVEIEHGHVHGPGGYQH